MTQPQQPELRRTGENAAVEDSAKTKAETDRGRAVPGARGRPVPEENQPGHHPETEQDKPTGRPSDRS